MAKLKFPNARADKQSSVIGASHDPATNKLSVHFRSGRSYEYSNVDADKARAFSGSSSKGSFVHQHLIGHHPTKEITDNATASSKSSAPRSKPGRSFKF